jgi:hypothetical protein
MIARTSRISPREFRWPPSASLIEMCALLPNRLVGCTGVNVVVIIVADF